MSLDIIMLSSLTKFQVYLRRNCEGEIDPKGDIWAVPYRWGCMVIAYKTNKFQKHKLAPIEVTSFSTDPVNSCKEFMRECKLELQDWADLWRPDLTGRISMVDSPREVVGAVLKYMGASYNTNDINLEVNGGRDAVKHNLALLAKQVLLLDDLSTVAVSFDWNIGTKPYKFIVGRKKYFTSLVFQIINYYILCICRFDSLIVEAI